MMYLQQKEQLQELKTYFKEMLEEDSDSVIANIENFKEVLATEEGDLPEVLIDFENYIRSSH